MSGKKDFFEYASLYAYIKLTTMCAKAFSLQHFYLAAEIKSSEWNSENISTVDLEEIFSIDCCGLSWFQKRSKRFSLN